MTPLTKLASALCQAHPHLLLESTAGRLTPLAFAPLHQELDAFAKGCGVYDLGWLQHIAVRGEDRVRWLSGMVTNAVQQLPEGQGNYSFLLNAQGRIQGDAYVYREADQLVLEIEAGQVDKLLAHLDHFIIMDDVTLQDMDVGAIGLAGSQTPEVLAKLGIAVPRLDASVAAVMQTASLGDLPVTLVGLKIGETPRYEIWAKPADLLAIWTKLVAAGASPCGLAAIETMRVLDAIPRYGVDLTDKDLAQETSQTRALNFNKGCYLGQEIVERIRSRGAVHRALRSFELSGSLPSLPAEIMADGKNIGKLTSAAKVPHGEIDLLIAQGIVRVDGLTSGAALTYNGGTAKPLDRPPAVLK
jgi:folate-binding protein YgfZ